MALREFHSGWGTPTDNTKLGFGRRNEEQPYPCRFQFLRPHPQEFVLAGQWIPAMLCGTMNRNGKLHALLSTARVANIPSVVSNVWVGVVIGMLRISTNQVNQSEGIVAWAIVSFAGVLLYVSGNFFNDWMDRAWDAKHRPERALPRGLFPSGLYAGMAMVLGIGGVLVASLASIASGWVAGGIAVCIVIYTLIHKRTAWGVIPMGLCRALLPVMGCFALFPYVDSVWPVACGLLCYIMGLSLSARYESMAEPPKWVAILGRGLLLGTAILVAWGNQKLFLARTPSVVGAIAYLFLTSLTLRIWNNPVSLLVSRLLAGIPLVDWMVLLPVSVMLFKYGQDPAFVIAWMCLLLPPVAVISARLLQRLAPAT